MSGASEQPRNQTASRSAVAAEATASIRLAAAAPNPWKALDERELAQACDRPEPGAWDVLMRTYRPRLVALLCSRHVVPAVAEELVAELWGEVALPPAEGNARTRLGTFQGACSLAGWLGVILIRRHIDRRRRQPASGAGRDPDGEAIDPPAPGPSDPHRESVHAEELAALRTALLAAWRELPARDAVVLGFRYGEDLPLEPIGRALGVGVPRVSRLLHRAEQRLHAALRRHLGSRWTDLERAGRVQAEVLGSFLASLRSRGDKAGKAARS
jgi:RNA polymerase sigma factor (sigma-70 family)